MNTINERFKQSSGCNPLTRNWLVVITALQLLTACSSKIVIGILTLEPDHLKSSYGPTIAKKLPSNISVERERSYVPRHVESDERLLRQRSIARSWSSNDRHSLALGCVCVCVCVCVCCVREYVVCVCVFVSVCCASVCVFMLNDCVCAVVRVVFLLWNLWVSSLVCVCCSHDRTLLFQRTALASGIGAWFGQCRCQWSHRSSSCRWHK